MIRITDTIKHLLIINVLFFAAKYVALQSGVNLTEHLGLFFIKNELFMPWQFVTTMFMHANVNHILFNMLALWMFGSALEQVWGKTKFLFFYFSAGIGASLIYTLVNYIQFDNVYSGLLSAGLSSNDISIILDTGSYNTSILKYVSQEALESFYSIYNAPAVGASGAIMGLLVGYGMLFPNAELMLLFFPVPVKAKYFIPVLIGLDIFSGLTGISIFSPNNTAYWAHIGGALIGFVMMMYWKKTQFNKNRWD
ncbi:MAG: rhomboid family intramembrane serine protease [Flavobacteriaceae bacterium]